MSHQDKKPKLAPGVPGSLLADRIASRLPFHRVDKILLFTTVALGGFGLLMIYSATRGSDGSAYYLKRQLVYFLLGILGMLLMASFDYRKLSPYRHIFYWATVGLLTLVFLFPSSGGANRWISLWLFDLQPSEIAKIMIIIVLASFVSERRMDIGGDNREFLKAMAMVLLPMLLIFLQPDLGMTLCIGAIFLVMMMVGGASFKQIASVVVASLGTIYLVLQFSLIKEYQMNRLLSFIRPDLDPLGSGYSLLQSKIAIGSGQLLGKGLMSGTQTNLKFIPAHHTDFIFSVVGEELGFIGAAVLLIMFGVLIWRAFKVATTARDQFGTLLAVGVMTMFLFQILVNVGMTMGIMPVTGITLPFLSFGGSSLIVNFMAVGLLLNVGIRRFPKT